jgi:hypothetical protein
MKDSAVRLRTKNDLRPEKFPDGTNYRNPNMNLDFENGKADSGARKSKGKSNLPAEAFRDGKQPRPEEVREAKPIAGAHRRAVNLQVYGNAEGAGSGSNPKHREKNQWGSEGKNR